MSKRWLTIRRQSLPVPTELPTDSGGKFLYLSAQWFAFVQGFIAELENEHIWIGSNEDIEGAIRSVLEIEANFSEEPMGAIEDVRVFEGKLQAFIDGQWVDKGALIQTWEGHYTTPAGLVFTVNGNPQNADFLPDFIIQGDGLYWKGYVGEPEYAYIGDVVGADGAQGIQGEPGIQGIQGEPGIQGIQGEPGIQGIQGEPGIQGIQGEQGIQGIQGEQGIQGIQGIQGEKGDTGPKGDPGDLSIYSPPPISDTDKYCYAAWALARAWGDELQDILELIDAAETTTGESIENIISGLVGYIPLIGSGAEAIAEFIHEGLIQPAIDYARENATDPDAIAYAAEQLYCAFQATHPNLENWYGEITLPPSIPSVIWDGVTGSWENFGDMIDYMYNQATGASAGGAILQWGYFSNILLDAVGLKEPIETTVAFLANNATFFDSRDCAAFDCGELPSDWEHTFNFAVSDGQWVPNVANLYGGGTAALGVHANGQWNSVFARLGFSDYREILQMDLTFADAEITEVQITAGQTGAPSGGTSQRFLKLYNNGVMTNEYTFAANGTTTITISSVTADRFELRHQASRNTTFSGCDNWVSSIRVRGNGQNPFI